MVKKEYNGVPRDFLEHHFLPSVLEASGGSNRKECVLRGVSTLITPVIDVMLLPCTLLSLVELLCITCPQEFYAYGT